MQTTNKFPPNYEAIKKAFPACEWKACFCYGDTIYNPFQIKLTPDLCEHEEVHSKRQGNNPELWWEKYISDPIFRLDEEIAAFSRQYEVMKPLFTNKGNKAFLTQIAKALSSDVYGNIITLQEAESRVRNFAKKNVV